MCTVDLLLHPRLQDNLTLELVTSVYSMSIVQALHFAHAWEFVNHQWELIIMIVAQVVRTCVYMYSIAVDNYTTTRMCTNSYCMYKLKHTCTGTHPYSTHVHMYISYLPRH